MKLVKLSCPNCNAQLEFNSEMDNLICNYCGTKLLVDDESIKVQVTGTLNISKLQSEIQDLQDYLDNGNIEKTIKEAERLYELYPNNKEIKNIYDKALNINKENKEKSVVKRDENSIIYSQNKKRIITIIIIFTIIYIIYIIISSLFN